MQIRHWLWLCGCVLLSSCTWTRDITIGPAFATPVVADAVVVVPTVPAQRLPLTPFPTRPAIPTMPPSSDSTIASIEAHTMQMYAQRVSAVASIEVTFSHPPIDGGMTSSDNQMLVSQGSGFVYDDQGHIVTNAHVVDTSNEYMVRLGDSQPISATVIGRDLASDLAVLALHQAVDVAPLPLSTRAPTVGMWVMTIGNPLGLRNTMTLGTISGIKRSLMGERTDTGFYRIPNIIQVDAAINPGSSGGVLLDSSGAVLGITTAIQSESGSFEGVGYAIPAQSIARIVPNLIATGRFAHPWLGISMRDVPATDGGGVRIVAVAPQSPAATAGLQSEIDIILAMDATPIQDSTDLDIWLSTAQVGQQTTATILRDGQVIQQSLTLADRPRGE